MPYLQSSGREIGSLTLKAPWMRGNLSSNLSSILVEINESYFYDIDVLFLVPSYPTLNFILGHFEISCQICSQFKY